MSNEDNTDGDLVIVYVIIGIVSFGILYNIVWHVCSENDESSVDSMDSPAETAAPMQVPFQQSNTPPPMHLPTMQSYQQTCHQGCCPSPNVPPPPTYTSNPPPLIAGTNQFCSNRPTDLPLPPPYAGSTWN